MIQKNIETISAKGITADMINKYSFLIEESIFLQMDYKIIYYFNLLLVTFLTKNGRLYSWKSKGISGESVTPSSTAEKSFYAKVIRL